MDEFEYFWKSLPFGRSAIWLAPKPKIKEFKCENDFTEFVDLIHQIIQVEPKDIHHVRSEQNVPKIE